MRAFVEVQRVCTVCILRHSISVTLLLFGVPGKRDKMRKWQHRPCLLGAHKWAGMLRKCCILGGPNKGYETKNGYITLTFSRVHAWAEL